MSDDYIIEKVEKIPNGENSESAYFHSVHMGSGKLPLSVKLKLWAMVIGGVVIGTVLFLFFLTAFVYLFIPIVILVTLWNLFNRRR